MALSPITPRDRVQRLADLGRKTWRYAWLVVVFGVVGGGLSLAFALTRPHSFQSWATLFYQEQIQSQFLATQREEASQRGIGDRYRELLQAHEQLDQILGDPKLNPFPKLKDPELAIDKLRLAIKFESHGANTFRIVYTDVDPDRAKAVTEKLTSLLQDKDEALRNKQAQMTVQFAVQKKEEATTQLRQKEQALAEFLAKHPEFALDPASGTQEGGAIRNLNSKTKTPTPVTTGNPRLYALERQRQRIQARLDAPPGTAPVLPPAAPSAERIASEALVSEARRALAQANKELEDALAKYTEKHPSVISAQAKVAAAQQKLAAAQAAVPPDDTQVIRPTTAQDRAELQKELQQIEAQIASEQSHGTKDATPAAGSAAAPVEDATNWVVKLETQHADLRRGASEARERVQYLADVVFRAQIDADQKLAEQGGRLQVVDPAFKPAKPSGPGKMIFLLAGTLLFVALGAALAVGLAVIDDRLYRRPDLDALGIATLAVIPPPEKAAKRKGTA
jgi:uncharacterized protein involved in exopolysaccharide biosynthesis